jgi:hypothetical protein
MNFDKVSPGPMSAPAAPNSMHPPVSLLQFTPLALFCNALLSAFNALRLNAPLALAADITFLVESSLLSASKSILARYRQEELAFSSAEQQGVQRLCTCFADDFVPHIQKCLQSLFPVTSLGAHLGLSPQQIQRDGIGFLKKNEVIDPIRHLLPVHIEPLSLISHEKTKEKAEEPIAVSENIVSHPEHSAELIEIEKPQLNEDVASATTESLIEIENIASDSTALAVPVKQLDANEDAMGTSSDSFDMCNSKLEEASSSVTNGIVESSETLEKQSDVELMQ